MSPFQRGKALKKEFERRRDASPSPIDDNGLPFSRIIKLRRTDAETRRRDDGAEPTGRFVDGYGVKVFPDGRRYEGDFREGAFEGQGTMTFPSGAVYTGRFRNGKRHGLGAMTFANGFRYEGHFRENRSHGYGALFFPDGTEYHGQFENGRFNGRGVLTFPDGGRYEGCFRDDRRHGLGTMTFPNGFKYEGQFADNRADGHGTLTYPGGARYVGQLKAGKCHGYGEMVYADGARYEGRFETGRYNGRGRLTYPDGTVYEGGFENDRRHGKGTVTLPGGGTETGHFVKGERLSDNPMGKKRTGKLTVVGKKPEESALLLDLDLPDFKLREDEPGKKTVGRKPRERSKPRRRSGHRTSDGHYVTSKEEIIVDNWLYMTGVRHVHEKRLPLEEEIYATFYLPEGRVCLEYWGESDRPEEKERKRRIFKNNHFNLIELRDEDFYNLDDVLSQKLLSCGIRAI